MNIYQVTGEHARLAVRQAKGPKTALPVAMAHLLAAPADIVEPQSPASPRPWSIITETPIVVRASLEPIVRARVDASLRGRQSQPKGGWGADKSSTLF